MTETPSVKGKQQLENRNSVANRHENRNSVANRNNSDGNSITNRKIAIEILFVLAMETL